MLYALACFFPSLDCFLSPLVCFLSLLAPLRCRWGAEAVLFLGLLLVCHFGALPMALPFLFSLLALPRRLQTEYQIRVP